VNEAEPSHDPDAEAAVRLRAAIGRLARKLRPTEAGAGLTPTQLSVLLAVLRSGPIGLSELAELEGLNPTMLSRVVSGLSEAGLVRRVVDEADRRAALVEATPRARRLRDRMRKERSDVLLAQITRLGPAERRALAAALPVLETLAELVGERAAPASAPTRGGRW